MVYFDLGALVFTMEDFALTPDMVFACLSVYEQTIVRPTYYIIIFYLPYNKFLMEK